jgi:soluble P-type ATPase
MMISIARPGQANLEIEFILIDFEGTLAQDRRVHPKAKDKINLLSKRAKIYILTKEEKNLVEEALKRVKAEIVSFMEGEASQKKLDFLRQLGATRTVVIGNGADDVPMIEDAGLGICVLSKEGIFTEAMKRADLVFINILDALDFLLKPLRQKATLGC